MISKFFIYTKNEDNLSSTIGNQLFTEALHISTLVEPNQMELGFTITNDNASYVAKEDSICLFSVAREAALNKQQIKPCVPYSQNTWSIDSNVKKQKIFFYKKA